LWYEYFVKKSGLSASRALVFAHRKMTQVGSSDIDRSIPRSVKARVVETDWHSTKDIRAAFSKFVASLNDDD
jgi:hypothetical protein